MANPFTFYKQPSNAKEHQANANWATYERMGACADLASFDALGVRAPQQVIADAHTSRWVEKEYQRKARQTRV